MSGSPHGYRLATVRNLSYSLATCATESHRLVSCRAQLSLIILLLCSNEWLSSVHTGHIMSFWLKLFRKPQHFPKKKKPHCTQCELHSSLQLLFETYFHSNIYLVGYTGDGVQKPKRPSNKVPIIFTDFNQE